MDKLSTRSKGRAIVTYVGMTMMLGATALSTDVALGFLTNAQFYLHIQAATGANGAVAVAVRPNPHSDAVADARK
jgi:NADPH-dependent curcumin reductase CurA